MIGHVTLGTNDLPNALAFYENLLGSSPKNKPRTRRGLFGASYAQLSLRRTLQSEIPPISVISSSRPQVDSVGTAVFTTAPPPPAAFRFVVRYSVYDAQPPAASVSGAAKPQ